MGTKSVSRFHNQDIRGLRQKLKDFKDESHEVERRREQREGPVHLLKDVIEEQRHNDHARDFDETGCEVRRELCRETQPAANEELGEYCRQ